MQSDIVPPGGTPKTKTAHRTPMKGARLRGQSLDRARQRLLGAETKAHQPYVDLHTSKHSLPAEDIETIVLDEAPSKIRFWHKWYDKWHDWNRRQKIIAGVLGSVLLLGLSSGVFLVAHKPAKKLPTPVQAQAAAPKTVASPLTGLQVAPDLVNRPVTGIMIENSLDARPQSGLQDAGVVFEAIAEGGITRFLALFQDTQPQYVGPVRSLRPYYIDWASGFDASIAHVGGSPDALAQIRGSGKDLDQFFNADSYWREASRPSPHDVYSGFAKLDSLNRSKGYTSSKYASWPRKVDRKLAAPTAKSIDLNISSSNFNVHYDYDVTSNSYQRSEGGKSHIVMASANDKVGVQLHPKTVIVLVMPYNVVDNAGHSSYGTTGSGSLYVFQDGGATHGSWTKADVSSQLSFTDEQGHPIRLDAGQAWITALQSDQLHYSP